MFSKNKRITQITTQITIVLLSSTCFFNNSGMALSPMMDTSTCVDQNGKPIVHVLEHQNEAQLLEISSALIPGAELISLQDQSTGIEFQNISQLTQGNALYNADGSLVNEYKIGGDIPNSMQSLLDRGFFKVPPMVDPNEAIYYKTPPMMGENPESQTNPRTISSMLRARKVIQEEGYKRTQDQILQKTQWFLDQAE